MDSQENVKISTGLHKSFNRSRKKIRIEILEKTWGKCIDISLEKDFKAVDEQVPSSKELSTESWQKLMRVNYILCVEASGWSSCYRELPLQQVVPESRL